jgi:hypothetical protein
MLSLSQIRHEIALGDAGKYHGPAGQLILEDALRDLLDRLIELNGD